MRTLAHINTKSIARMTEDILATATIRRDADPADMLRICVGMRRHFYRWYIEGLYLAWAQGRRTTYQVLDEILRSLEGQVNADAKLLARSIRNVAY